MKTVHSFVLWIAPHLVLFSFSLSAIAGPPENMIQIGAQTEQIFDEIHRQTSFQNWQKSYLLAASIKAPDEIYSLYVMDSIAKNYPQVSEDFLRRIGDASRDYYSVKSTNKTVEDFVDFAFAGISTGETLYRGGMPSKETVFSLAYSGQAVIENSTSRNSNHFLADTVFISDGISRELPYASSDIYSGTAFMERILEHAETSTALRNALEARTRTLFDLSLSDDLQQFQHKLPQAAESLHRIETKLGIEKLESNSTEIAKNLERQLSQVKKLVSTLRIQGSGEGKKTYSLNGEKTGERQTINLPAGLLTEEEKRDRRNYLDAAFSPIFAAIGYFRSTAKTKDDATSAAVLQAGASLVYTAISVGIGVMTASAATCNVVGIVVGLGITLVSLFSADGAENEVLRQIQQLREQVAELHRDMRVQFGFLRDQLNEMLITSVVAFDDIERILARNAEYSQRAIAESQRGIQEILELQNRLAANQRLADLQEDYARMNESVALIQGRPLSGIGSSPSELFEADFRKTLNSVHTFAVDRSKKVSSVGNQIGVLSSPFGSDDFFTKWLEATEWSREPSTTVFALQAALEKVGNPISPADVVLANYSMWSDAARRYQELAMEFPDHYVAFDHVTNKQNARLVRRSVDRDVSKVLFLTKLKALWKEGRNHQKAIEKIVWTKDGKSNTELLLRLTDAYEQELQSIAGYFLEKKYREFDKDTLTRGLDPYQSLAEQPELAHPFTEIKPCPTPGAPNIGSISLALNDKEEQAQLRTLIPKAYYLLEHLQFGRIVVCIDTFKTDWVHRGIRNRYNRKDSGDTPIATPRLVIKGSFIPVVKKSPFSEPLLIFHKELTSLESRVIIPYAEPPHWSSTDPYHKRFGFNYAMSTPVPHSGGASDIPESFGWTLAEEITRRWELGELKHSFLYPEKDPKSLIVVPKSEGWTNVRREPKPGKIIVPSIKDVTFNKEVLLSLERKSVPPHRDLAKFEARKELDVAGVERSTHAAEKALADFFESHRNKLEKQLFSELPRIEINGGEKVLTDASSGELYKKLRAVSGAKALLVKVLQYAYQHDLERDEGLRQSVDNIKDGEQVLLTLRANLLHLLKPQDRARNSETLFLAPLLLPVRQFVDYIQDSAARKELAALERFSSTHPYIKDVRQLGYLFAEQSKLFVPKIGGNDSIDNEMTNLEMLYFQIMREYPELKNAAPLMEKGEGTVSPIHAGTSVPIAEVIPCFSEPGWPALKLDPNEQASFSAAMESGIGNAENARGEKISSRALLLGYQLGYLKPVVCYNRDLSLSGLLRNHANRKTLFLVNASLGRLNHLESSEMPSQSQQGVAPLSSAERVLLREDLAQQNIPMNDRTRIITAFNSYREDVSSEWKWVAPAFSPADYQILVSTLAKYGSSKAMDLAMLPPVFEWLVRDENGPKLCGEAAMEILHNYSRLPSTSEKFEAWKLQYKNSTSEQRAAFFN